MSVCQVVLIAYIMICRYVKATNLGEYQILEYVPAKEKDGVAGYPKVTTGTIKDPWQWVLAGYHLFLFFLFLYFMRVSITWANRLKEEEDILTDKLEPNENPSEA